MASTGPTVGAFTGQGCNNIGTIVGVVGRRREVPVDNPERGDWDCHNKNTSCRPIDNPLHGVQACHTLYTELELTDVTVPIAAATVGDAAAEFDPYSDPYLNHQ